MTQKSVLTKRMEAKEDRERQKDGKRNRERRESVLQSISKEGLSL